MNIFSNMKRYLLLAILGMTTFHGVAQQDAIYSQYMFNPFVVNPAYAGSRESFSTVLLARSQWVGINGAPNTQTLSIHAPFSGKRAAYGLNVTNDVIGPTRTTGIFGTYAYHLPLGPGKLSMGLRGGVYNSRLDRSLLEYEDPTDKFSNTGTVNALVPSFDFGAYYYTTRFYLGLSTTHLSQQRIGYNDYPDEANLFLRRHFMLGTGYAFSLNEKVVFKPSVLLKYVDAAPLNIDINGSFLFNEIFWLGASVRTGTGIVLITEYNITDFLRVGYSYDIVTNDLAAYNRGSHEIFIGFDFALKKNRMISTRYL